MDGDFPIEVSAAVTERVLAAVYKALSDHKVLLEGTLLKPNMVRSGSDAKVQANPKEIAEFTVRTTKYFTNSFEILTKRNTFFYFD